MKPALCLKAWCGLWGGWLVPAVGRPSTLHLGRRSYGVEVVSATSPSVSLAVSGWLSQGGWDEPHLVSPSAGMVMLTSKHKRSNVAQSQNELWLWSHHLTPRGGRPQGDLTPPADSQLHRAAERGHTQLKPKCVFLQLFSRLGPDAVALSWAKVQLEIMNVITL